MAINLSCPDCYKTYKLKTSKCKCGNDLKKNKLFRVRVKLPNNKWKSKTVKTLDMAKKVEAKFSTQVIEQEIFNIHPISFIDDIWDNYMKWAKHNKKSWKDDEVRWSLHIKQHIKGFQMDKITPQIVQGILSDMYVKESDKGTPYKPATIKQVLVLLKRVFNWSIKQNLYYGVNPCNSIETPKFDNTVTNPLDSEGIKSLFNVLTQWENERAVLVIKFALYSGKRRGEILKLKWDNINLESGHLTLIASNTKSKKAQTLPLNNKCLQILRRCEEMKTSDYVFPCSTGKYFSGFNNTWRRIRTKAQINIRFHDLRHTYASYLASSGKVDIYTLKELLGHSTIEMTQRYAHLVNGALRKASCVVDEVFR